jgi:AraC-like DNA-binding protein
MSPQNYSLTKRYKLLIEQHYLDFGPVRDYAEKLCVTERQLNDALKRTLGKTAGQLVQERMALEAKRLLSNTDLSMAEIAFQLNFEDFSYFCRFFKRHAQATPSEFKKRMSSVAK